MRVMRSSSAERELVGVRDVNGLESFVGQGS